MDLELLQFPYSTFNEKVRWALDFKGLHYSRRNLLPGPHIARLKRLTGNTTTPVLRIGDIYIDDSARIIAELERRFPQPNLYPDDAEARTEALRIQTWIDTDIGPRTRRSILHRIIADARYTAELFGEGQAPLTRRLYAATFPLARGLIRRGNGITGPASIADGDEAMAAALEFAATRTAATGFCVGSAFSVADLALASILAGGANPPGSTMDRPSPRPAALEQWTARWATHPGMAWVLRMYADFRPPNRRTE